MHQLQAYKNLFIGRWNDYAQQRDDGGYYRVGRALTLADLDAHIQGKRTLGTYLMNERGLCSFAVFDDDTPNGLQRLRELQEQLTNRAIPATLEASRRGGHLWVFFREPVPASQVRAWLVPLCPSDMEFYPKQAETRAGYGSLIRLPLGIHRKSGKRYPFVVWTARGPVPVARTIPETLAWLATVERATVPPLVVPDPTPTQEESFSSLAYRLTPTIPATIRDWCALQDPYRVIGSYVDLNSQGVGCCPFGEHHAHGKDSHASFKVYDPGRAGGYCWYCYVWQRGGSVFDFLRYYHGVEARDLWKRLQAEQRSEGKR